MVGSVVRAVMFSAQVLEQMPLYDGLSWFSEHLVPMLHLYRSALGTEHQLSYGLVAAHAVVVHDTDDQRRLANPVVRHDERKRLVVLRVQRFLFDYRLLLFDLLAVSHQPDLHIRICNTHALRAT